MKHLSQLSYETAVEGVAHPLWGSASGSEAAAESFEFSFTPCRQKQVTRSVRPARSTAERLFEATAGAKIWTSRVAMKLDRATRDRLFRQLDNLHDEDEWFEGDAPIQLDSFKSFVRAIIAGAIGGKPGLSLTPQGNLVATWSDGDAKLSIEFQPDNFARFLWRQVVDGEVERMAGVSKITRLSALLRSLEARGWLLGS